MTPQQPQTDLESAAGLSRRSLLERSAVAGAGVVLSGGIAELFGADALAGGRKVGYGPLIDDPAGLLSLPKGFDYSIVAQSGVTTLETGEPTPSDPDGTASFERRGGGTILINNHELSGSEDHLVPHVEGLVYDPDAVGGTTTIEVDRNGERIREYVSLAGTSTNCAGGRSPWETWLSCEETEEILGKPHGYVFEVDPHRPKANRDPQPIKALGRFAHESVAVDPRAGTIYQTEDATNPNGLFYRWTPPRRALPLGRGSLGELRDKAGTLEAMKAFNRRGKYIADLSSISQPGTKLTVEWVDVPDRDATEVSVRKQFDIGEVTRSRKLEGMWWGDGGAYFVASFARNTDGSAGQHDGQVWFLDPRRDTIELKLHFAYTPSNQDSDPDGPDNITVSPYGGVIIAEDGDGLSHLVGATDRGEPYFFARNEDAENSEFTGPTFSRDKKILFANVQSPGYVYSIRGPWTKQR